MVSERSNRIFAATAVRKGLCGAALLAFAAVGHVVALRSARRLFDAVEDSIQRSLRAAIDTAYNGSVAAAANNIAPAVAPIPGKEKLDSSSGGSKSRSGGTISPRTTTATIATGTADDTWPPARMLDALLDGGAGPRRLVVAASNAEYADFADNFAHSLQAQNVSNFVLVPLDDDAYAILHMAYPQHTLPLWRPGLASSPHQNRTAGEATFGSAAFQQLTSTRPAFLRPFLEQGYAILYNDIDMVWQRNAWDVIDDREKKALAATANQPSPEPRITSTLWHDGPGQLCTCMLYFLPTNGSIALLTQWEKEIATNRYTTDQFAFIALAKRLRFPFGGGARRGVRVYRSDEEFPRGRDYAWDAAAVPPNHNNNNRRAVIVHNNWISGKQAKRDRFEAAGLWKPSGRVAAATRP